MMSAIDAIFPGLAGKDFKVTSAKDADYNCIAWAVGVTDDWWWPGGTRRTHWPAGVPRQETMNAFQLAFETLGFESCSTEVAEAGFEKVAIFADSQGIPKHAARQLMTGRWTSKLGKMEDIEHDLHKVNPEK